ncbi:hypothetical protein RMATCC62417_16141 [Rhizopus microsporus]|nr:hypothetical protein RMATCC62417_16141 [Rhizopus microsporus]
MPCELKQQNRRTAGFQPTSSTNRHVFAYGDASLPSSKKYFTPSSSKKLRRHLSKKAVVILVDEYKTSKICSHRQTELYSIPVPERGYNCSHKKKKRLPHEKNASRKCLGEVNGHEQVLCRFSACQAKTQTASTPIIYPLKLYRQCLAGNSGGNLVWNRDVNAALNIRLILVIYVQSGCNINTRPAALNRVFEPAL